MANQEHLEILKQGIDVWNTWWKQHPDVKADLMGADLSRANLSEAWLIGAQLSGADFSGTDLTGADFTGANLSGTIMVGTNLTNTTLKDCIIYGISVWDVKLDGAKQLNLVITPEDQSIITVDNLKIAQFFYLLL